MERSIWRQGWKIVLGMRSKGSINFRIVRNYTERVEVCEVVQSSVGEVRSRTDWDPVWTGPNPAVPVQVRDFPKITGPLGLRSGHSHIA